MRTKLSLIFALLFLCSCASAPSDSTSTLIPPTEPPPTPLPEQTDTPHKQVETISVGDLYGTWADFNSGYVLFLVENGDYHWTPKDSDHGRFQFEGTTLTLVSRRSPGPGCNTYSSTYEIEFVNEDMLKFTWIESECPSTPMGDFTWKRMSE